MKCNRVVIVAVVCELFVCLKYSQDWRHGLGEALLGLPWLPVVVFHKGCEQSLQDIWRDSVSKTPAVQWQCAVVFQVFTLILICHLISLSSESVFWGFTTGISVRLSALNSTGKWPITAQINDQKLMMVVN